MIQDQLKNQVVGVDINVHSTTIAVVDVRGNILEQSSFDTVNYEFIGDFVAVLADHIL